MADDPKVKEVEAATQPQAAPAAAAAPDVPWWLTPTGDGPVEKYLDHPLNPRRQRWLARSIRGLTGLLGRADFALADILVGMLEFYAEARGPQGGPGPSGVRGGHDDG